MPGIFSTGPIIWVSMDLPGPQLSYLRHFGPWGQILDPRVLWPQIWKLQFSHKTLQYGCLWTWLDPSIHIWGNLDPGAKFWAQGPFGPILKNCYFPLNLAIWVSIDLPGPQHSYLKWFGPRDQIFGPMALWPQIQKFAIFSQNPTIWVSMDSPGPQHSNFR